MKNQDYRNPKADFIVQNHGSYQSNKGENYKY